MTQAVIGNLNNLQEFLVSNETKLSAVDKQVDSLEKTDFNKILDDKKQVATISDMKEIKNQLSETQSTITENTKETINQLSEIESITGNAKETANQLSEIEFTITESSKDNNFLDAEIKEIDDLTSARFNI